MRAGSDIRIVGAGVIGLALALELRHRGAGVSVEDAGSPSSGQASWAAAGMLAAEDPHNPPALRPLALWSRALYPAFLQQIALLSGTEVPFQTECTVQYGHANSSSEVLREHSLDPRQLMPALRQATEVAGVKIFASNSKMAASERVVLTAGAWSALPAVTPRKGQMLRVAIPSASTLREVHRSAEVYIVPRTVGPQAGTALIGATLEDAGYDVSTNPEALRALRARAALLLPALTNEQDFPVVEAWAGLRPATPDGLPLLGEWPNDLPSGLAVSSTGTRRFVATGHFRNGILLAPATAVALADLLEGQTPAVTLDPFVPARFTNAPVTTTFGPSNRYSHARG